MDETSLVFEAQSARVIVPARMKTVQGVAPLFASQTLSLEHKVTQRTLKSRDNYD